MHAMEELKAMLCKELEEFAKKGELTAGALETVHKLTDTIKNIGKIEAMDGLDEYSERAYSRRYYGDGSSYARRRDSMGRYTRDDGYSEARRGRRGYSRAEAKDYMIEEIEDMMMKAETEKEKQALQRALTALENA